VRARFAPVRRVRQEARGARGCLGVVERQQPPLPVPRRTKQRGAIAGSAGSVPVAGPRTARWSSAHGLARELSLPTVLRRTGSPQQVRLGQVPDRGGEPGLGVRERGDGLVEPAPERSLERHARRRYRRATTAPAGP
jgi:hypothetical protein